jgi:hypothetical protein
VCSGVTGFLDEAFLLLRLGRVSKLTCKAIGGTECTWELRLAPDVDISDLATFE